MGKERPDIPKRMRDDWIGWSLTLHANNILSPKYTLSIRVMQFLSVLCTLQSDYIAVNSQMGEFSSVTNNNFVVD